jgi:hypothetical protein
MQLTRRDELMLEWLRVVRFADVEAIRWALSAVAGTGERGPVSRRRAQQWTQRMVEVGLLGKTKPSYQRASIVWPTQVGRAPDLYKQTFRHELTVATVSARYLARGYSWTRDRPAVSVQDHQGDGVAIRDGLVDLVEVELTPKTSRRYRVICNSHADRLASGAISRVVYLGTPDATRAILREADRHLFRDLRPRLIAVPVFDLRALWSGADDAPWAEHLMAPAPTVSAPGLWEAEPA